MTWVIWMTFREVSFPLTPDHSLSLYLENPCTSEIYAYILTLSDRSDLPLLKKNAPTEIHDVNRMTASDDMPSKTWSFS
jgi:hypothetical protein